VHRKSTISWCVYNYPEFGRDTVFEKFFDTLRQRNPSLYVGNNDPFSARTPSFRDKERSASPVSYRHLVQRHNHGTLLLKSGRINRNERSATPLRGHHCLRFARGVWISNRQRMHLARECGASGVVNNGGPLAAAAGCLANGLQTAAVEPARPNGHNSECFSRFSGQSVRPTSVLNIREHAPGISRSTWP
jgi:hypothetical protein